MTEKDDELTITMKFKGTPDAVVQALVHGLPQDALVEFRSALDAEMAKRVEQPAPAAVGGSER